MQTKFFLMGLFPKISKKGGYMLVIIAMLAGQAQIGATDYSSKAASVQQQITVTGIVTDEQGEPLPGVNIQLKGTTTGQATNLDGTFSINVPREDAVLVFSFLGFTTQEIRVGSQRNLNVRMSENTRQIEEVVVIGYGTQKKATLTGSVVSVANKELITTKNTNVQNMLTGKLPGVRNIQKTSEPGQFTNYFDIRGLGAPLIIVDGVPRGDIPRMDPNEIESISILKDASSAVYGVRAANGVVLITTKAGERGKAKIEYSGYYGIQVPTEILKTLNSWDRATMLNEINMRVVYYPRLFYDEAYFQDLKDRKMPDTDWYDVVMRNRAPQQQHNISVSGGTDKIDYFINFGYTNQEGFFKTNSNNYNRYNLRTNVNAQITNRLKVGIKLSMNMDENNQQTMGTWSVFSNLWRIRPEDPVYANDTQPYYYYFPGLTNPLASITTDESGFVKNKGNRLYTNMYLEYDIPKIKGLKSQFMLSYDKAYGDNTSYNKAYYEYLYNAANQSYDGYLKNNQTQLTRTFSNSYGTLWNVRLSYDNIFLGKHNLSALLLYEESYSQSYNFSASRYFDISIPYLFAGNPTNQVGNGSGLSENANKAVVGRATYDYVGKYLGEFAFRYDGSSNFPKGSQWGFFPSASVGYRISEESFVKDNIPFLQNLKIRFSWGQVGDDGAAAFQFLEGFDYPAAGGGGLSNTTTNGAVFGDTFVNGLGFRNAPNKYLTWYSATTMNVGVDADLWNGLFGFSVDLFQRNRDGLLDSPIAVIPLTFGSGISQANLNSDRTKGFEVELRHRNNINQFQYGVTTFVQLTRSQWTERIFYNRSNSYENWLTNPVNRYKDVWFGYGAEGTYQSYDEVANSIYANSGTLPGDPIYTDWNGDGVINSADMYPIATTTSPGTDMTATQNLPLMNFALTLNGQWKWFDFNVLFQGAAMSYVGYSNQVNDLLPWDGNSPTIHLDRWHPSDPAANPYDRNTTWISGYFPYGRIRPDLSSEFNIQNGAYLRLKSVDIGFTIPQKIVLEKIGVKNMRIFFNGYNLWTLTGVYGLDPEHPSELYGMAYPLNRTFNFGGTITF